MPVDSVYVEIVKEGLQLGTFMAGLTTGVITMLAAGLYDLILNTDA